MRRETAAALLLALALSPAACGRSAARWGEAWSDDWRGEANASRQSRPGDRWVILRREPSPTGARETRERWTMVAARDGHGEFRVERDAGRVATRWEPLHPVVPTTRRPRGRGWVESVRVETVRVPAGRYRCARTSRSFTEHEGRVMQVDEWWAPNVPVPVQRWTRWNAHAYGPLREPPRTAADQLLGTTWDVLERAPGR